MTMRSCIAFACAAACALAPAHLRAEEALSQERALTAAYADNPELAAARTDIAAARGELVSARALPAPGMEFEIGGLKANEDGKRIATLDKVSVVQEIEPPGVWGQKTKIAELEIAMREESARAVWSDRYVAVREQYNRIILDKKRLQVSGENLRILRQFTSKVELKFQSGKALKDEVQRAQIELLQSETAFLAAEKTLRVDKARLNLLLGRPVAADFDVQEDLREETIDPDLEALTAAALRQRPDVRAETLALRARQEELAMEQLKRLPSPFVGYERVTTDYENDSTIKLGMTMPVWGLNQGGVQKAAAAKDAQSVKAAAMRREAALDVYEAYLDAELSRRKVALLKKGLEEANELLRVADLRYSEGQIDFLNFLDQVRKATETRVAYYEGLFELSNAVSRLEKAAYTSLRKERYFP